MASNATQNSSGLVGGIAVGEDYYKTFKRLISCCLRIEEI